MKLNSRSLLIAFVFAMSLGSLDAWGEDYLGSTTFYNWYRQRDPVLASMIDSNGARVEGALHFEVGHLRSGFIHVPSLALGALGAGLVHLQWGNAWGTGSAGAVALGLSEWAGIGINSRLQPVRVFFRPLGGTGSEVQIPLTELGVLPGADGRIAVWDDKLGYRNFPARPIVNRSRVGEEAFVQMEYELTVPHSSGDISITNNRIAMRLAERTVSTGANHSEETRSTFLQLPDGSFQPIFQLRTSGNQTQFIFRHDIRNPNVSPIPVYVANESELSVFVDGNSDEHPWREQAYDRVHHLWNYSRVPTTLPQDVTARGYSRVAEIARPLHGTNETDIFRALLAFSNDQLTDAWAPLGSSGGSVGGPACEHVMDASRPRPSTGPADTSITQL